MADFDNYNFQYGGKRYSLDVSIKDNLQEDNMITLDNQFIEEFSYANELNGLYLTGHVIYYDKTGKLAQLFGKFHTYCDVTFCEMKDTQSQQMTISKQDKDYTFTHTFIVDNIQIIERIHRENIIKYKINLVSVKWYNLMANVAYTNYDDTPMSIMSIMKEFITQNKLQAGKTFDYSDDAVKLQYITQENDNIFTVFDYLFSRLYYYEARDSAMRFMYYNQNTDTYEVLDMSNKFTYGKRFSAMVSLFGSQTEEMAETKPTDFSTIIRMPKTEMFQSFFKHVIHTYDFDTNSLGKYQIGDTEITKYYNNKPDDYKFKPKATGIDMWKELRYNTMGSLWSNKDSIYQTQVRNLLDQDSLVLKTDGFITRRPSDTIVVSIDKNLNDIKSANKTEYDELLERYRQFEGVWIIGKVVNRIVPSSSEKMSSFRQELSLIRNWTNNDDKSK